MKPQSRTGMPTNIVTLLLLITIGFLYWISSRPQEIDHSLAKKNGTDAAQSESADGEVDENERVGRAWDRAASDWKEGHGE